MTQTTTLTVERNPIARIGFFTSLVGVVSLFAIGLFGPLISWIAAWCAFLSLPGLIMSVAGLVRQPRRLACFGVALGIYGSLYLPTLWRTL